MKSLRYALLLLILFAAFPAIPARAALSDYVFATGTGSTITPPSYTSLWAGTIPVARRRPDRDRRFRASSRS